MAGVILETYHSSLYEERIRKYRYIDTVLETTFALQMQ
jgi:hypothetical protein